MAVKKIFWENPYQVELTTIVKSVENDVVTLYETIIYAFSGGQHSDTATVNGYQVLLAKKVDKEIFYTLEPSHNLKIGDEIKIIIDWERRYKLMKLHFAAEIILELVNQNFNHPEKFGANITPEKARLDFIWTTNISEMFPILEPKAKELIEADLPIISDFSDLENEIRYWKIDGFGQIACGGTHLKRTGEIGALRLKRDRQGKNKERIEIFLI